jgi:hypothetical protein
VYRMVIRFLAGALLAWIFPILGTIALAVFILAVLLLWGTEDDDLENPPNHVQPNCALHVGANSFRYRASGEGA